MSEVVLRGFGWRHAGRRAWAVRDVDLRIAHGERVLLLGASGAGKSTLLSALAGLLPQDSGTAEGTVEIDGLEPRKARERVGLLFQDPQAQLVMARSGDDVAFGLENRGVAAGDIWARVGEALERVGFPYPLSRRTAALSGGEAQRLALAGVLALRPGLLLLDEPTANLDPAGAALIRSALTRSALTRSVRGGSVRGGSVPGRGHDSDSTMILVEHRVAEALPLVDRVVVLEPGGGVRADGPPDAVFAAHGASLSAQGVWVPGRPCAPRKATGAPGAPLVRTEDVTVRHRLAPVTMSTREAEVLAVTGPNGAGKSTLALVLGGLLRPTGGRVEAAPGGAPVSWRAPVLARRIGSVFQAPEHQFVTSRVVDELTLAHPAPSTVDDLLDRLRLTKLANANPFTLSGGEARRLSVATALAAAPRLLVLDEPTFGQDRRTWIELVDLLAGLRDEGHGIIAVTHDDALVAALADRVHTVGAPTTGHTPTTGPPAAPAERAHTGSPLTAGPPTAARPGDR